MFCVILETWSGAQKEPYMYIMCDGIDLISEVLIFSWMPSTHVLKLSGHTFESIMKK